MRATALSRATPWPAPGLAAPLRSVFAVRPSAPALGDVLSKHHAKPTFECVSYNEKTRFGYALRNDPTVILIVCDYLVVEFLLHHFDVARGSKGPYCYVSPLLSPASFRLSRLGPRRDLHNALELLFLMLLLLPPQVSLSDSLRNFQGRSLSNDIPVSFGLSRSTSLISRLFPYCQGATLTNPVANEV